MNSKYSLYAPPTERLKTPNKQGRNRSTSNLTMRKNNTQQKNQIESEILYLASELKETKEKNMQLQNENAELQRSLAKLSHDNSVLTISLQSSNEKVNQLQYELTYMTDMRDECKKCEISNSILANLSAFLSANQILTSETQSALNHVNSIKTKEAFNKFQNKLLNDTMSTLRNKVSELASDKKEMQRLKMLTEDLNNSLNVAEAKMKNYKEELERTRDHSIYKSISAKPSQQIIHNYSHNK